MKIKNLIRNLLFYKKSSIINIKAQVSPFCKITNSKIDKYSYVNMRSTINNTEIGKFCSIAQNFSSGIGFHPIDFPSSSPIFYSKNNYFGNSFVDVDFFKDSERVIIGNDVWIGANVTIADGVIIGDGTIIAAHSFVKNNVDPYSIVGGAPAKLIKYRFTEKEISILKELKWWDLDESLLRDDFFNKKLNFDELEKFYNKIYKP